MNIETRPPRLAAERIEKRYPGVRALQDVSFELRSGEVHALVGENGAGKSTLVRILSGAEPPDSGRILVDGQTVEFSSPAEAHRHGIRTIFQELALVPWLTVAENIVLGDEPAVAGVLNRREAETVARGALQQLAVSIAPGAHISTLSTAERQLVEIGRALLTNAPVLIMDEPTSSLAHNEVERLFGIVRRLRERGHSILFVSHRLDEVRAIADRITVLRGGRVVSSQQGTETDTSELIRHMVGRSLTELFPERNRKPGRVALRVRGLTRSGAFEGVSFEARAGEVLGFVGLVGAGRTEVMRAVAGIDRYDAGSIELEGRETVIRRPADAIRRGIVYLPEDRMGLGLVLELSGYENIVLPSLRRYRRFGFLDHGRIRETGDAFSRRLLIRGHLGRSVRTLSGGNQQKIVLAKWLQKEPRVLILDEPTRGIDVGAKREVFALMRELCAAGAAVLFISSELSEVTNTANRIVVMSGGRVQDILDEPDFDEERILRSAFAAHTEGRAPDGLEASARS